MERFRPDNWWELWLRPLLMLDPGGGVYVEFPAPDLRFVVLLVFAGIVALSKRWRELVPGTRRALIGLFITMWCWTYISGNGRYFLPGLLLVGPLTIALLAALKVSTLMRWTLVGFVVVGQIVIVTVMYVANPMANLTWDDLDPIGLPASPLRAEPAVFTVVGGNAYAALVPRFHPDSQWVSFLGHYLIPPRSVEYERLTQVLASPKKKYVVVDASRSSSDKAAEEMSQLLAALNSMLAKHDLRLREEPCQFLGRKSNAAHARPSSIDLGQLGLWFCRFEPEPNPVARVLPADLSPLQRDAFASVERSCPRFFTPNGGQDFRGEGVSVRMYSGTDTQLIARDNGKVAYRYQLALNTTPIGQVDEVVSGAKTVNCDKLVGRYELPWKR